MKFTKRINDFIEELASKCSEVEATSGPNKGEIHPCFTRFARIVPILRREIEQGNYALIREIANEKGVKIPKALMKDM